MPITLSEINADNISAAREAAKAQQSKMEELEKRVTELEAIVLTIEALVMP